MYIACCIDKPYDTWAQNACTGLKDCSSCAQAGCQLPTLLEGEEAGASGSEATTMSFQAAGGDAGEQPPAFSLCQCAAQATALVTKCACLGWAA